jgi:hypothetical protein
VFHLLAGSFAVVSKAMGGVDVVNLGINTIDLLGIFLIAWNIVAIGPIAVSLADKAEPLTLNFRALLGGSMLGIIYR